MKFNILFFSCSLLFGYISKSQPISSYKTLKYDDLVKLNKTLPYVNYYGKDSTLLVFGSSHTTQFNDPQIDAIERLIYNYRPSVILYEGDGTDKAESKSKTVRIYSEMGLAKYLADSLHIRAINIEPDPKKKFRFLLSKFSLDEVLLATLGLQITIMQYENEDFETKYPLMIASLLHEGLPLTPKQQTVGYFYKVYQTYFHHAFSYTHFDSRTIQAKYSKTTLNKVNQTANEFRDQHIIQLVHNLVNQKQRIFLLVGGWHAIVCEPAFISLVR